MRSAPDDRQLMCDRRRFFFLAAWIGKVLAQEVRVITFAAIDNCW